MTRNGSIYFVVAGLPLLLASMGVLVQGLARIVGGAL